METYVILHGGGRRAGADVVDAAAHSTAEPVDEIVKTADTVIVRPDPAPETAS